MRKDSKIRKYYNKKTEPVSKTLEYIANKTSTSDRITLSELLYNLRHRGFGLLMLVLVLPNCVPIPIPPGGSTLLSIPLFIVAFQMIWGRNAPWLPKWLRRKSLDRKTLNKVAMLAAPKLRKIERLLHPRFEFTTSKSGERIIGAFWLLFTISIAVPLPMTNFIPGIGILVMALGLLGRDGLVVIIGALIGLLGIAFTVALFYLGLEAVLGILPFLS